MQTPKINRVPKPRFGMGLIRDTSEFITWNGEGEDNFQDVLRFSQNLKGGDVQF